VTLRTQMRGIGECTKTRAAAAGGCTQRRCSKDNTYDKVCDKDNAGDAGSCSLDSCEVGWRTGAYTVTLVHFTAQPEPFLTENTP
jgi:hypothetical protein